MTVSVPPRALWQYALCSVFAAAAAADSSLIASYLFNQTTEPVPIVLWHCVTLGAALSCLVSIWRRRLWAPYAVAAWGVANTTLVLAVPFFVTVGPEGVPSIWLGAAVVGVLAAVCVWVVRSRLRNP